MTVKEEIVDQDTSMEEDTYTLNSLLDAFAMLAKCGITVPSRDLPSDEMTCRSQR